MKGGGGGGGQGRRKKRGMFLRVPRRSEKLLAVGGVIKTTTGLGFNGVLMKYAMFLKYFLVWFEQLKGLQEVFWSPYSNVTIRECGKVVEQFDGKHYALFQ